MATTGPAEALAGRYQLDRLLGRGGMGEVWSATDRRLQRPVAVKLLLPELARLDDVRRRFASEARSAASLSHPNVVAVFDTGEDDEGIPFLVMECLPGRTLADVLRDGPLEAGAVRRLGRQVLAAVQAAHDRRLVHRDVKPANILRSADGLWKVADFGIAKTLEDHTDLTASGSVLGTPAYLAPERLYGQAATPSADLYAVGVVLYEALCGHKPFQGDTPIAVAHQIASQAPPPLDHTGADRALTTAIVRAMAKDPTQRFESAAAMARALDHFDPPPAVTRPEPTAVLPPAPVPARRRYRWVPVVALVVMILIGALLGVALAGNDEQGDGDGSPTTAPQNLPDALDQLRREVTE